MAVKIGDKIFRNEQEQVQKNMKDIEVLKQYIKEAYKCSSELTSSTDQVLKSSTNVGEDVTSGWLMDSIGNLFTITGGDDTYLLLDFFTSLRGPEGEQGEQGTPGTTAIDDSETSLSKTWSSKKISDKMDLISDKGIYYTFVQPTLNGDDYELDTSDLENPNQYTFQKYNDIIVYIDGDGKVKEIYKVVSVSGDFSIIYLEKVGDVGAEQLYVHCIHIASSSISVDIVIYCYDNEAFDLVKLKSYLVDRGFTSNSTGYAVVGEAYNSNSSNWVNIPKCIYCTENSNPNIYCRISTTSSYTSVSIGSATITDTFAPV